MGETYKSNVYFQPPKSISMNYPAIVYKKDSGNSRFADDHAYIYRRRYQITYITRDPDDPTPDAIARLPLCLSARQFTVDNLYHEVFNLYF